MIFKNDSRQLNIFQTSPKVFVTTVRCIRVSFLSIINIVYLLASRCVQKQICIPRRYVCMYVRKECTCRRQSGERSLFVHYLRRAKMIPYTAKLALALVSVIVLFVRSSLEFIEQVAICVINENYAVLFAVCRTKTHAIGVSRAIFTNQSGELVVRSSTSAEQKRFTVN